MVGEEQPEALSKRIGRIEGRVMEHANALSSLRETMVSFELRIDKRFDSVDQRFGALDRKIGQGLDDVRRDLGRRIDGLDAKLDQRFGWLVGIQVATLLAVVAAMAAILAR